jgi:hypothetical protein
MNQKQQVASGLADAFLAGDLDQAGLAARGSAALERNFPWLLSLAQRVQQNFAARWPVPRRELTRFISEDPDYATAWSGVWERPEERPQIRRYFLQPEAMGTPIPALDGGEVPPLATPADLAAWLGLSCPELDWLADLWGSERRSAPGPLRHYCYRWVPKRRCGRRLLEIPKSRLRGIQRRILHGILDQVPPHDAAQGFRAGRSCLSHARVHTDREVVLRLDLSSFFTQVPGRRVHALFAALGYPEAVARLLAGLCSNRTPHDALAAASLPGEPPLPWQQRQLYRQPHLPQGAPSSPALANLALYRLDVRLAAAAQALGAVYTRYADDLAFSGGRELERSAERFHVLVCRVALEEGFPIQTRKTRVMRRGVRQQLTGIVVNAHPNLPRPQYDRLKALLYNCVRFGPASQNRDGYPDFRARVAGQVAYVASLNPARGAKLRTLFDQIDW